MAKVQQTIRLRDELKDQIIDRRVEELLNPNTKWDSPSGTTEAVTSPKVGMITKQVDLADTPDTPTDLEGEWILESTVFGVGKLFEATAGLRTRFRGHQYSSPGPLGPTVCRLETYLRKGLKTLVIHPDEKDKSNLSFRRRADYRIDGDTLVIQWSKNHDGSDGGRQTFKRVRDEQPLVMLYLNERLSDGTIAPVSEASPIGKVIWSNEVIPGGFGLAVGKSELLLQKKGSGNPKTDLSLTVEIPKPSEAAYDCLSVHGLQPIVRNAELKRASDGGEIIEVIYLPQGKSKPEVLINDDSEVDDTVIDSATKLGTVLAVVRIKTIDANRFLSELDGEWYLKSITGEGVNIQEQKLKAQVQSQKWRMLDGDQKRSYSIVLNPYVNPKTIDMTGVESNGAAEATSKGIYRIDGDTLVVGWGGNEAVRPTNFDSQVARTDTWIRIHQADKFVQVRMTSPAGATLTPQWKRNTPLGIAIPNFTLPGRFMQESGTITRLQISGIPSRPGVSLWLSLEIPYPVAASREFLRNNALPVQFTEEDLAQSEVGNVVVKVLYLPSTNNVPTAVPNVETLVNTRLSPGVDVVTEARKRGTVLAIVQNLQTSIRDEAGANLEIFAAPYMPVVTDSGATPIPLTDAVNEFNAKRGKHQTHPEQQPLTEEEVVAAIRWILLREKTPEFDAGELQALRQIAEEQIMPAGWTIQANLSTAKGRSKSALLPSSPAIWSSPGSPGLAWQIELKEYPQDPETVDRFTQRPGLLVRQEFVSWTRAATSDMSRIALASPYESLSQLQMTIKNFNDSYNTIAGQKQLPLTDNEVFAAIFEWQFRRDEAPVTDREFLEFQAIRDTKKLPVGAKLEVVQQFQPNEEYTFDIWSVRIVMPRTDEPNTTNAYIIRQKYIRSTRAGRDNKPRAHKKAMENLRTLMLAQRNYYDQYKRFPAAVIYGKDGKGTVPHSWRVEILPQLGEQKLYDEYHFEEPWDSEHNKTILAKMPDVFRSLFDSPQSSNASYFAVVTPGLPPSAPGGDAGAGGLSAGAGAPDAPDTVQRYNLGTMFSNPRGATLGDLTDGTSNIVCLVEAKRDIPWTKPDDIAYLVGSPPPKFGGWFPEGWHAGMADGTAKFISAQNDDAAVRALLTPGGGEIVNTTKLVEDVK